LNNSSRVDIGRLAPILIQSMSGCRVRRAHMPERRLEPSHLLQELSGGRASARATLRRLGASKAAGLDRTAAAVMWTTSAPQIAPCQCSNGGA